MTQFAQWQYEAYFRNAHFAEQHTVPIWNMFHNCITERHTHVGNCATYMAQHMVLNLIQVNEITPNATTSQHTQQYFQNLSLQSLRAFVWQAHSYGIRYVFVVIYLERTRTHNFLKHKKHARIKNPAVQECAHSLSHVYKCTYPSWPVENLSKLQSSVDGLLSLFESKM